MEINQQVFFLCRLTIKFTLFHPPTTRFSSQLKNFKFFPFAETWNAWKMSLKLFDSSNRGLLLDDLEPILASIVCVVSRRYSTFFCLFVSWNNIFSRDFVCEIKFSCFTEKIRRNELFVELMLIHWDAKLEAWNIFAIEKKCFALKLKLWMKGSSACICTKFAFRRSKYFKSENNFIFSHYVSFDIPRVWLQLSS